MAALRSAARRAPDARREPDGGRPTVVGVRHHSPACARLVEHVIRTERPRHVLIEGPSDFNERIGELALGHTLPIAIFTHYQDAVRRHASWTPFCAYSPEWVALETAREVGAEARFCDLPAWHAAFAGRRNRYGDAEGHSDRARQQRAIAHLCERMHADDMDALWEHLFEQPMAPAVLAERLRTYFAELRADAPGGERDEPREALMARWVAWALHDADRHGADRHDADRHDADRHGEGGGVVVVCGGWHAPVIEREALRLVASGAVTEEPAGERPDGDASAGRVRCGSDLVPYTYKRLDSFAGYDSGMPSPAYHEWVFEDGHARAGERALATCVERVRARRQSLSTADLVAASTLTSALASLRAHPVPMRTDVLDGLAGALVKDGLEAPFPWAVRGTLSPRTDPILVEVVAALSGDRRGALAAGTPRPPLTHDVRRELARHDLEPRGTRTLTLPLREPEGRARSRVLHRLRVLGIPGFQREAGPAWATDVVLEERWALSEPLEQEAALIEASEWGATLEGAALARLEDALVAAGGRLGALAAILGEAVFVGVRGLEATVMDAVARAIGEEPSLAELGRAAAKLLDLTLHGELFDAQNAAQLDAVLVAAFDRGLWLLEGLGGALSPEGGEVAAVVVMRDLLLRGPAEITRARARADGVLARRATDPQAPPAIRGACLGAQWSLGRLGDEGVATASDAVRGAALPATLGDFLSGLFATARAEVLESRELVRVIDEVLSDLGDHETLVALPSLRLAFAWFPPIERRRIAEHVALVRGLGAADAHALVAPLRVSPAEVARGHALDAALEALVRRHGLFDALDAEGAS